MPYEITSGDANESALKLLFPARNRLQQLRMVGESKPNAVPLLKALGLIADTWHSETLNLFLENDAVVEIARERKGRLEGTEVTIAQRMPQPEGLEGY